MSRGSIYRGRSADGGVILVGEIEGEPVEGTNVVMRSVLDGLRCRGTDVLALDPRSRVRTALALLRNARSGCPVVFAHGPGLGVLLLTVALRLAGASAIVWIATRPDLPRWVLRLPFRPRSAHIVFCNRVTPELAAVAPGARLVRHHIGVDVSRLVESNPTEPRERAAGPPVVLHVGHLRANRGLEALARVQTRLAGRVQVRVVGSPKFEPDREVMSDLEDSGVEVRVGTVQQLGELYRSADLYVFPVPPESRGAVDLPLTVIESLMCGTPVVSTRFGALSEAMPDQPGLRFCSVDEIPSVVEEVLDGAPLEVRSSSLREFDVQSLVDLLAASVNQMADQ